MLLAACSLAVEISTCVLRTLMCLYTVGTTKKALLVPRILDGCHNWDPAPVMTCGSGRTALLLLASDKGVTET